jgi:AcrR family transcriptional regulator
MTVSEPLAPAEMTSGQLARRAKLIETVVALIQEVGPEAVQMRDVAERSGIALGTAYRYFASKEHLFAVALTEWQDRLTRRIVQNARAELGATSADEQVRTYLRRELRGFARNPQLAALMVRMHVSPDPHARATLIRMRDANTAVMRGLLSDLDPATARRLQAALDAVLINAVVHWVTGRATMPAVAAELDAVAQLILAPYATTSGRSA